MGRDGDGDELEVGYIPLQNNVACAFPLPSDDMFEAPASFDRAWWEWTWSGKREREVVHSHKFSIRALGSKSE